MIGLALLLAVGLAILWIAVVAMTAWSLTHPPRRTYAWSVARGKPSDPGELDEPAPFESWTFRSRGRDLPVWDIAGLDEGGPVVICSHGWADSRLGVLVRLSALRRGASRVIAWDLPGHGEAPGISGLGAREVDDLVALIGRVPGDRVVLYGWSLGAGLSIAAATREGASGRIVGVVSESPYVDPVTPARAVIEQMGMPHRLTLPPAMWLLGLLFGVGPNWSRGQGGPGASGFPGFDRAEHAARLQLPLLVLHGEEDGICPLEHARRIAERAGAHAQLEIVRGAGHNDLWKDDARQRCTEIVLSFVRQLRGEPTTRSARAAGALDAGAGT